MLLRILLSAFLILVTTQQTNAIDIVTTYDSAQSQPPAFDSDASRLQGLVDAAVGIFEDIIEDDFTIDLAFTWGDLGDDGTLGVATTLNTRDGRPTSSRMRFNTNDSVDWFLDPTPDNHDEYQLIQTTVRDLSSADLVDSFSGVPPELLEVGYAGVRANSENTMDLFSVILHEIGHAVGLTTISIGASANDGDFDIPAQFLGGATAGISVSSEDDIAHLAAPRTSLFPVVVPDIRRLPSATDIFAIASAAGWEEIDLPRKEFLDGSNWNDASSWIGNRVPDAEDTVTIRHGDEVSITSMAVADSLEVLDGSSLAVVGELSVNDLELETGNHRVVVGDTFVGIRAEDTATLAGELQIEVSDALSPGQAFSLLTADSIEGNFSTITTPAPEADRGFVLDVFDDEIALTIAHTGDLNLDGFVDFNDFLGLATNFAQDGVWRDGDFTGDGRVAFDDFVAMARQFGRVEPLVSAVPEPNAATILSLVMAVVCGLNRTSRNA